MPDDATVEILLRVKEQNMALFAEATAALGRIREALNKYREAEATGATVDRATQEALGALMDRALLAGVGFKELKGQVTDARQALTHYSEAIVAGMPEDAAEAAVLLDLALQYKEVTAATNDATTAKNRNTTAQIAANAASAWAFINGPGGWAQIAIWAGVAAIALAPISALILSAAVALVSFTVGAAGAVAVMGGVIAAFGALGAVTLVLGIGGMGNTANSPWTKFKNEAGAAIDKLREQAEPLTVQILDWAAKGIPAVEKLGSSIMAWFGQRIPGVLRGVGQVVKDLTPAFEQFGQFLGSVMDHVGPQIAPLAEAFAKLALSGLQGFITNLVRLSDWFQKEAPTLGPIVKDVFGALGNVIQAVATNWAKLSGWVVANWPQTMKDAKAELGKLQTAFNDLFDPSGKGGAGDRTLAGLQSIGQTFKGVADGIASLLGGLGQLNRALQPIADVLNAINAALSANGWWLRDRIDQLGGIVSANPGGSGQPGPPGGGRGGAGAPRAPITIHNLNINGAQSPAATARAVAQQLRRVTQS